jgi:zinc/manganese transport system substrate-binding protein
VCADAHGYAIAGILPWAPRGVNQIFYFNGGASLLHSGDTHFVWKEIDMVRHHLVRLSLLISLWLTACQAAATPTAPGQLNIVATYSILGDIVQNVGGAQINLHVLVGPNGDPHAFEPSPSDSVKLAQAALIFENGLAFETWLDDLYEASGSTAPRIVTTQDLAPRPLAEAEHAADEHAHGEFDPHVWHSVANVIQMTKVIREALVQADPAHAAVYQANAEAYLQQLQELDTWVYAEVKKLPENQRRLVTSHDTFGYFAERYGFEIIGTALGAVSTEGADPSAAEVAALVDDIRSAGVSALFAENVHNPALMQQIADEAGVRLAPPLYSDALGEPGSAGDTYLKLMRYNVTTIVDALGR